MKEDAVDLLLCRVGNRLCALPLLHVVETMRVLPIQPVASSVPGLEGTAIIRGAPCPVLSLGRLLGVEERPTRLVVVRVLGGPHSAEHRVALAVSEVAGVARSGRAALHSLPPLLRGADSSLVAALGTLDAELVAVLETGALLSESQWAELQPA